MPAIRNNINPMLRKFRWNYGSKRKDGYLEVKYHGKIYLVHRLVAETFLDNPDNLPTVDHKNRVKTANFVSNLRWANYSMQQSNTQRVDVSLAKYGVRCCEDPNAYNRALRANNPEFAERQRAKERARKREYQAKQKALGRRYRRCPDGKHQWISDAEYNERYKDGLK